MEKFRTQAKVEEQNLELAKRYAETLNEGDFEAFKELLSPEYAIYSPSGYPEPTLREKLIENYRGVRKVFPEFTWTIEDITAAKDKVICRIIIRGTYRGGIPDVPVTEEDFKFSQITIMRMKDGKVVEEWQEDDQLGFVRFPHNNVA
jgi:steroid delta-isomerase-like uncharacterized protein